MDETPPEMTPEEREERDREFWDERYREAYGWYGGSERLDDPVWHRVVPKEHEERVDVSLDPSHVIGC